MTVLVLALLGGTTAAFAITEALKLERSPVTAPKFDKRFSPTCACPTATASLGLRFRKRDSVDAVVLDSGDHTVRTLFEGRKMPKGDAVFRWDGRDDAGRIVPDGRYRIQIHLDRQRRTIVIPNPVLVDTKAPRVRVVDVPRLAFSPDGDGRRDRVTVVYRASEKARADLLVDGRVAVRGKARPSGKANLSWGGELGGANLAAGTYRVSIQARDRAGNLSEPTQPVTVRIRYIDLTRNVFLVPRNGILRFRVVTDALPFRWYLFKPRGGRAGRALLFDVAAGRNAVAARLPKALKPGRYLLRVAANGHRDRAIVVVTRAGR